MTTIVAVRKNGAVALGADTLSKDGSTMQRAGLFLNSSKIIRVGASLLSCPGTSAWNHVLARYFSRLEKPADLDGVDPVFEAVHKMHAVMKREYTLVPHTDGEFETTRISLMIVNPSGAYAVYSDRSVNEVGTFWAFGSGYRIALGAMHAAYGRLQRPEQIAQAGIEAAAEFDEDTGLPAEVHRVEMAHAGNGRRRKTAANRVSA